MSLQLAAVLLGDLTTEDDRDFVRLADGAVGEPVMLIETQPGGERQIGIHAHKHPAPMSVVEIEVVLYHPAFGDPKVPAVRLPVADCRHDPSWLSGLEDDDDLVRPGALEVALDKFIAAALRRLDNRSAPSVGPLLDPGLKLFCGTAQYIAVTG
jgi:hypothetical protein